MVPDVLTIASTVLSVLGVGILFVSKKQTTVGSFVTACGLSLSITQAIIGIMRMYGTDAEHVDDVSDLVFGWYRAARTHLA